MILPSFTRVWRVNCQCKQLTTGSDVTGCHQVMTVPTVIAALYLSNIVVYKDEFGSKNIKSEFLSLVKKIMFNDVPNIGVGCQ